MDGSGDMRRPVPGDRPAPRVLVVDDNAANRRVAELALLRHPVEVLAVADGPSALERLAAEPFDLVLLDGMMPGMDGPATVREIRRRERAAGVPPIPVVALTASSEDEDRQRMLDAGMDGHLVKPLQPEELGALLGRWLGGATRSVTIPEASEPAGRDKVPAPAPAPADPILDPRRFAHLLDLGDARFVERIVALFLADAAERVAQADEALAAGDVASLRQALHALEGIAGTIGAVALDRRVRALHDEVRRQAADRDAGAPAGPSALAPLLDATRAALRDRLAAAER